MSYMFFDCISLKSIDVSSFNTEKVEEMQYMFKYCKSLTSINLSNFNTKNVKNIDEMFYDCSKIIFLDISNFIIDKEKVYLFNNLPAKGTININKNTKNKIFTIPKNWKINIIN